MHLGLTSSVEKSAPITVTVNCRACGAQKITAVAVNRIERFKLFHVIPIGTARTTLVTCPKCHVDMKSSVRAEELRRYPPGELARFLNVRVSPVLILLLISAVPTLVVPWVSLILSGAALAMGWKHGGAVRKIALAEIVAGFILLGLFFALGFFK